jgi:hypothetical protein
MDSDIAAWMKACKICGLSKPVQDTHYEMLRSGVATHPLAKLFADFIDKFSYSKLGISYVTLCDNTFSKFC